MNITIIYKDGEKVIIHPSNLFLPAPSIEIRDGWFSIKKSGRFIHGQYNWLDAHIYIKDDTDNRYSNIFSTLPKVNIDVTRHKGETWHLEGCNIKEISKMKNDPSVLKICSFEDMSNSIMVSVGIAHACVTYES